MLSVQLQNEGTVNKNKVTLKNGDKSLTIYFSYETPIAYRVGYEFPVCSENEWSQTTGKYLNHIEPNKQARIPHSRLMILLGEEIAKITA